MRIRFAIVCISLMAAVGSSAVPAQASTESAFCDPFGADLLHNGVAGTGFQGRGGIAREPDLSETHADLPASAKNRASARFRATVPVWLHDVTAGTTGALTDAQIAAQIDVLNTTFAGAEGGANDRLPLRAGRRHATDNASLVLRRFRRIGRELDEAALHQGGRRDAQPLHDGRCRLLGCAYLPDILTKPGQAFLDGVVINWRRCRGRRPSSRASTTRVRRRRTRSGTG